MKKTKDKKWYPINLMEAYLNLNQDAFKHNKRGLLWNESRVYIGYTWVNLVDPLYLYTITTTSKVVDEWM